MTISVLIIDDSKASRDGLQTLLSEAGYTVLAAGYAEGMRLSQEIQPGLIITDIMIPERDGIEAMMEIRQQRPEIKILAMTGFRHSGSIDFAELLCRLGADDVLVKPFAPEVLLAKVDRLASQPVALTAA